MQFSRVATKAYDPCESIMPFQTHRSPPQDDAAIHLPPFAVKSASKSYARTWLSGRGGIVRM
eukprot:scaffold344980_cov17-Prasinocladus_malaysianus.AAC.1